MKKISLEAKELLTDSELYEIKAGASSMNSMNSECGLMCSTCVGCASSCLACLSVAMDMVKIPIH